MSGSESLSAAEVRRLVKSRDLQHVVVLGANGTMGYGSAALFTQAVPEVTFLARTEAKAEEGLGGGDQAGALPHRRRRAPRSATTSTTSRRPSPAPTWSSRPSPRTSTIKKDMFDKRRGGPPRRLDRRHRDLGPLDQRALRGPRATRSAATSSGLHFFNPPNVIVGTELIAGRDTDPEVVDFVEAFSRVRLGREMIRTADTPGLRRQPRGLQGAERGGAARGDSIGPLLVDRARGPLHGSRA